MNFDEFAEKLRKIKTDFRRAHGKPLETLEELEKFLDRRLAVTTPRAAKAARSLKGMFG
jgi:hypothetical protein